MTVQATTRRAGPTVGNSAATNFPFAFKVFVGTDLQVILTTLASGTQQVLTLNDPAGYTVVLNGDQNANPGGTVIYNPSGVPMPNTQSLTITSVVPQVQGTHIINGGAFFANNVEDAIDKVLINLQDLALNVGNSVRFPSSDSVALNAILPGALARANQALLFDSAGNVVAGLAGNAPISSAWQPVVAAASLAAGRLVMGHSAYFDSLIAAATKAAFTALFTPLTTKGDLWVFGAADNRFPVGADGLAVIADATKALGVDYKTVFNDSAQTDVASATPNIFAALTSVVRLTGTNDIAGFDAVCPLGKTRLVTVQTTGGMLTNGANLINPLPFDIQMMAGDWFTVVGQGGTVARLVRYVRANGQVLLGGRIPFGVLLFGALNLPASATNYCARGLGMAPTAEANVFVAVSEACTISQLRGVASAALGGGTAAFTLRKNGVDTALTATLAAASGTTFSDTTHSVDFDEGDVISLKAVAGAIGGTTDFGVSMVVNKRGLSVGVPSQFWFNSSSAAVAAASILDYGTTPTESDAEFPLPPCRIRTRAPYDAVYQAAGTYIGASLRKNAAVPNGLRYSSPLALLNAGGVYSFGMVGPAIGFSESDLFNARQVSGDSDAIGVKQSFDALGPSDLENPKSLLHFYSFQQVQAQTRFAGAYAGFAVSSSTTETDCQVPMPACTLRGLRVAGSAAPAAGQTLTVTIRKNGVDQTLTCTVTSAGRLASDLVNSVVFANGELLSVKCVTSATSGTRTFNVTVEVNPL